MCFVVGRWWYSKFCTSTNSNKYIGKLSGLKPNSWLFGLTKYYLQIVDIWFVTKYHYLVFSWEPNNLVNRIFGQPNNVHAFPTQSHVLTWGGPNTNKSNRPTYIWIYFFIDKRASLACAVRLADTLCPPKAHFGRLGSPLINYKGNNISKYVCPTVIIDTTRKITKFINF